MPRSTMFWCSSGSTTARRAWRTSSRRGGSGTASLSQHSSARRAGQTKTGGARGPRRSREERCCYCRRGMRPTVLSRTGSLPAGRGEVVGGLATRPRELLDAVRNLAGAALDLVGAAIDVLLRAADDAPGRLAPLAELALSLGTRALDPPLEAVALGRAPALELAQVGREPAAQAAELPLDARSRGVRPHRLGDVVARGEGRPDRDQDRALRLGEGGFDARALGAGAPVGGPAGRAGAARGRPRLRTRLRLAAARLVALAGGGGALARRRALGLGTRTCLAPGAGLAVAVLALRVGGHGCVNPSSDGDSPPGQYGAIRILVLTTIVIPARALP